VRILLLSWRDIKHPHRGGAEVLTHQMARRWVLAGHTVRWFAAAYAGSTPRETIDGVEILRRGRPWTVQWHAYHSYRPDEFDVVVDQVNTLPFFTPLYIRTPHLGFFNQLCREIWFYEKSVPLSLLGYLIEPVYLQLYRWTTCMCISESTKRSLRTLGLRDAQVLPMGISFEPVGEPGPKEPAPTFIYVGRLVRSKRVDHILHAFATFIERGHAGTLWIVGNGPQRQSLARLAAQLGLTQLVTFWGFVPQEKKHELMARAHALLATSVREGWGLIVTEANAYGTPAVVYDVPGLRDSVRHGATGLVTRRNRPQDLCSAMEELLEDRAQYCRMQQAALEWSRELSFDVTARAALQILEQHIHGQHAARIGHRANSQQR